MPSVWMARQRVRSDQGTSGIERNVAGIYGTGNKMWLFIASHKQHTKWTENAHPTMAPNGVRSRSNVTFGNGLQCLTWLWIEPKQHLRKALQTHSSLLMKYKWQNSTRYSISPLQFFRTKWMKEFPVSSSSGIRHSFGHYRFLSV